MKENVLERNARLDTERKIADFRVKQQMDYAFKVKYAKIRAWEFYDHPDVAGSCYVAVGGLDSITLLLFLRSIGIDVPAISVSSLEDKSIQLIHKQLGVKPLKPLKSKVEVLRLATAGTFPISKFTITRAICGSLPACGRQNTDLRPGQSPARRRAGGMWRKRHGTTDK